MNELGTESKTSSPGWLLSPAMIDRPWPWTLSGLTAEFWFPLTLQVRHQLWEIRDGGDCDMIIQVPRLVNSSWHMRQNGYHGEGRKEVVKGGHVTSLTVSCGRTWHMVPHTGEPFISLAFITMPLAMPTAALPWKQTSENSPSHW